MGVPVAAQKGVDAMRLFLGKQRSKWQPLIGMGRGAGGDPGVVQPGKIGVAAERLELTRIAIDEASLLGRRDASQWAGQAPRRAQRIHSGWASRALSQDESSRTAP